MKRVKKLSRNEPPSGTQLGVAWYRSEQWALLLEISADRDDLERTFEEWEAEATKRLADLRARGLGISKVLVDVERLGQWCEAMGLSVDGRSRSRYVAEELRKRDLEGI